MHHPRTMMHPADTAGGVALGLDVGRYCVDIQLFGDAPDHYSEASLLRKGIGEEPYAAFE